MRWCAWSLAVACTAVSAWSCAKGVPGDGYASGEGHDAAPGEGEGGSSSGGPGGTSGGGSSGGGAGGHDGSTASSSSGSSSGAASSSGGSSGSGGTSSSGSSSGGAGSSGSSSGGTGSSGGTDASTIDAAGLDPGLVLPAPGGDPCSDPGQQCSGPEICRISSTTGGTCEGCTNCGNLHAPCTADADCDILFQCYEGFCDPLCPLATPQVCGVPTDCINVGNATTGICRYP